MLTRSQVKKERDAPSQLWPLSAGFPGESVREEAGLLRFVHAAAASCVCALCVLRLPHALCRLEALLALRSMLCLHPCMNLTSTLSSLSC